MEEIIITTFQSLFAAFILALIFAPIMIYFLYRMNQTTEHKKNKLGGGMEGDNSLFLVFHKGKNGIPNMGGIMVWLIVPLTMLIMLAITQEYKIFIVAFLLYGFWGFLDVLFTNMIKHNPDLRRIQEKFSVRLIRFIASISISAFTIYLLWSSDLLQSITIFGVTISLSIATLLILAVVGQFAVYSAEITDGLDGLMIGIFGISLTAFGALLLFQGDYSFLPVIGIMIGVILVDLYFNINPARFYNGGPSAMPLGFATFYIALLTDNIIPYFFITGITWIIMSSSMIQIFSMRFFKRRIFKMAPLHHHFQVIGWPETKITMRFWLFTMILSIVGIYIGIVL